MLFFLGDSLHLARDPTQDVEVSASRKWLIHNEGGVPMAQAA